MYAIRSYYAYAAFSPMFHFDAVAGLYVGGQFWDGRAATLADQSYNFV